MRESIDLQSIHLWSLIMDHAENCASCRFKVQQVIAHYFELIKD